MAKSAPKKMSAFRLSDESKALLKLVAAKLKRSEGNTLEVLIEEKAEALKIKLPKK